MYVNYVVFTKIENCCILNSFNWNFFNFEQFKNKIGKIRIIIIFISHALNKKIKHVYNNLKKKFLKPKAHENCLLFSFKKLKRIRF